jgi:hypothetical protein
VQRRVYDVLAVLEAVGIVECAPGKGRSGARLSIKPEILRPRAVLSVSKCKYTRVVYHKGILFIILVFSAFYSVGDGCDCASSC